MSRHLSLIGAALLLTCCNQPQEYQVNIDNVDSTINNDIAQPELNADAAYADACYRLNRRWACDYIADVKNDIANESNETAQQALCRKGDPAMCEGAH